MINMNTKKQKLEKQSADLKKSDLVLYKLMISFALVIVGICGMLTVGKSLQNAAFFRTNILPVLLILSALALIAAIVFFCLRRKNRVDESDKIVTSANLLGTAVVFFGSCLYYELAFDASQVIMMLICAIVLYFVYNAFTKSFFICSLSAAAGINLIRMATVSTPTVAGIGISLAAKVLGIAVPVLFLVFGIMLFAGKGSAFGKKVLTKSDRALSLIIVSVIALAGGVLALVLPAYAVYATTALIVVYLAFAIAYIVRMM